MRLDDDRKLFLEFIGETANVLDIHQEFVEKDYWLVLLLKEIFAKSNDYVFKGGTSLSKCYHLINRFSEDIDISYSEPYESLSASDINRRFKGITKAIKEVGLDIENKEQLRRSAYFNQFRCPYPSFFNSGTVEAKVIIELAGQTPSFPSHRMIIQSFIGEYLEKINRHDLAMLYSLQSFEINVQALERTIVDKTFAICDYYLDNKTKNHSRHLYDIHKILSAIDLNSDLANLFSEVRNYRQKIVVCKSAQEGNKLNDILNRIIEDDSFEKDYTGKTQNLLYENISYNQVKQSLITLKDFLSEFDV